jgi:phosphate/sulfate permease
MNENLQNIRKISNRLAIALCTLIILIILGGFLALTTNFVTAPVAAFAAGIIGGFVGLQRRLKTMSQNDLELLANSWVYVCLSPVVGGVLAVVLYILFISTLVSGDLFPAFEAISHAGDEHVNKGFAEIFNVEGGTVDYAKMMFWSFVAGFSERFVTDIISKFDNSPTEGGKPNT